MPHSQMAGTLCFFLAIPFLLFLVSGIIELRRTRRYPGFRSVDGKPARLVGTTRAAADLRTPFGGDACCWYEAAVKMSDAVLTRESSALIPSYVDSAMGEALVDPETPGNLARKLAARYSARSCPWI